MRSQSPWYQNQRKITTHTYTYTKLYVNIADEHRCKNPQQDISKQNPVYIKRVIHHDQVGFTSKMQRIFNICKLVSMINHINKLNKNHVIISIDTGKAFDRIQYPFMIKNSPQKMDIEDTIKAVYDKPTANIIPSGDKLKAFPLRSGTRHECPLLPLFQEFIFDCTGSCCYVQAFSSCSEQGYSLLQLMDFLLWWLLSCRTQPLGM